MNPTHVIPAGSVLMGLGVLIAVISVPLLFRKVPPNHWYGVRIPASFVSSENWYAVNEYGAKRLMGLAGQLVVLSLVYFALRPLPWWADTVFLLSPLVLLLPFVRAIFRFADSLPKE